MLAGKLGQVEVISGTLIMRWVNVQLSRLSDWVDRTIEQEVCPLSYLCVSMQSAS